VVVLWNLTAKSHPALAVFCQCKAHKAAVQLKIAIGSKARTAKPHLDQLNYSLSRSKKRSLADPWLVRGLVRQIPGVREPRKPVGAGFRALRKGLLTIPADPVLDQSSSHASLARPAAAVDCAWFTSSVFWSKKSSSRSSRDRGISDPASATPLQRARVKCFLTTW